MAWPDIAEKNSYLRHDTAVDNRDHEERSNTSMIMLMLDEVRRNQAKSYVHALLPLAAITAPTLDR
jgi:hypothetical protein